MAFHQLEPTIPVHVIGKGAGYAFAVIDYGQEHNLIWVTALNESGEIWCAPNPQVRLAGNWTMGRARPGEPAPAQCGDPPARAHTPAETETGGTRLNGVAPS